MNITLIVTDAGPLITLLAADPAVLSRNRGEQAASEVLARELAAGVGGAMLLFEDAGLKKTNFLVRMPDNVLLLSTSSYLYEACRCRGQSLIFPPAPLPAPAFADHIA